MAPTAFDRYHPVVAFCYFVVLLVVEMAAMQPVYLTISFSAALACSVSLRGARATGRTLAWQLPLVAVIALANPLFSASGSTEIFRLGVRAFYLESFAFGACMGLMLATVLLTLESASRVLTSDKVMALFGNAAPTVGLMLSMTARLVPQFVRRGTDIGGVQRACTAARSSVGESGGDDAPPRPPRRRAARQPAPVVGAHGLEHGGLARDRERHEGARLGSGRAAHDVRAAPFPAP